MIYLTRFCLTLFLTVSFLSIALGGDLAEHQEKFAAFEEKFAGRAEAIAQWCEDEGLSAEAEAARALKFSPEAKDQLFFFILPQEVQNPTLAEETEERQGKEGKKSLSLRKNTKKAEQLTPREQFQLKTDRLKLAASRYLFQLAEKALEDGHTMYAFDLLMHTLEKNPDHAQARRILGYERVQDLWLSPFEKHQMRTQVYHPQFGWLPEDFVPRYENGERFFKGQWITEKEDAAYHFDIEDGWTVETPHFTIQTNHSLPAAVKIGEQAEVLYRVWKQLFLRCFATDAQIKALFSGRASSRSGASASRTYGSGTNGKHRIVFFRNRENYVRHLSPRYPLVSQSRGIYIMEDQASYFFAGEHFDRATMLHEVTHQLFNEVRKTSPNIPQKPNFWLIEGAAVYMESLRDEENRHVVGGFGVPRLLAARIRYSKGFYVPLEELSAMNTEEFQTHPEMQKLYSQSAGLMHFLLHFQNGRYQDAAADILKEIYSGKSTKNTIPEHLGKSFEELDEEYGKFISRNQEELSQWEMD